ncbi:unnamed protein product [Boreogadus saida]
MFSVAVLLLLLAAGSGVNSEQLTQPESLTVRPGQPLTIRCQHLYRGQVGLARLADLSTVRCENGNGRGQMA